MACSRVIFNFTLRLNREKSPVIAILHVNMQGVDTARLKLWVSDKTLDWSIVSKF